MKKLFEGKVFDMHLGTNSVVFSYWGGDTEDGKKAVLYKMVSLENNTVSDAPQSVYFLSKFGQNYLSAVKCSEYFIEASAIYFPDGKVFLLNPDGSAALFDHNGEMTWNGELKYKGKIPSSLVLHKDELWGTVTEYDAIVKFNVNTLREELRIGGKGSQITAPGSMFVEEDFAYICLPPKNKIMKINLLTFEPSDYLFFEEPVYGFVKSGEKQYVLLESGVYRI